MNETVDLTPRLMSLLLQSRRDPRGASGCDIVAWRSQINRPQYAQGVRHAEQAAWPLSSQMPSCTEQ
jgi:hypothetical protein